MKRLMIFLVLSLLLLGLTAAPAVANGPPVEETFVFGPFPIANPCTGADTTFTFTLTGRVHAFELSDPVRHHINIHYEGIVETGDGFSGSDREAEVDNGAGPHGAEEGGMFNFVSNAVLTNGSGQRIKSHILFHVTVVGGVWSPVIFNFSLDCLGAPS